MEDQLIKAWMAGFVDGEGCITIAKQVRKNRPTPSWRPFITITNTHKGSLEIFKERHGGDINEFPDNLKLRQFPTAEALAVTRGEEYALQLVAPNKK